MKDKILNRLIGTLEANEIPYDSLMPRRVSNLLLVTSLYDYYTIIEDGKLEQFRADRYAGWQSELGRMIHADGTTLAQIGAEPFGSSPEKAASYLHTEIEKYAKVARAINLKID